MKLNVSKTTLRNAVGEQKVTGPESVIRQTTAGEEIKAKSGTHKSTGRPRDEEQRNEKPSSSGSTKASSHKQGDEKKMTGIREPNRQRRGRGIWWAREESDRRNEART